MLDILPTLEKLENFRFSYVVANAVKQEDIELVCWAAFLLHEYAIRGELIFYFFIRNHFHFQIFVK